MANQKPFKSLYHDFIERRRRSYIQRRNSLLFSLVRDKEIKNKMAKVLFDAKKISSSMLVSALNDLEVGKYADVFGFDDVSMLRDYVSSTMQLLKTLPGKLFNHHISEKGLGYMITREK